MMSEEARDHNVDPTWFGTMRIDRSRLFTAISSLRELEANEPDDLEPRVVLYLVGTHSVTCIPVPRLA